MGKPSYRRRGGTQPGVWMCTWTIRHMQSEGSPGKRPPRTAQQEGTELLEQATQRSTCADGHQTDLATNCGSPDVAGVQKHNSQKGNRQRRQGSITDKTGSWEEDECSVSPGNSRKQKQHMRSREKLAHPGNRKPFSLVDQRGQRKRVERCSWRTGFKVPYKENYKGLPWRSSG